MKSPRPVEPNVWRYELSDGFEVLAGKTDIDNDILSTQTARPNDLWFHVHGLPGSHVILRHPEDKKPDKNLVKQAASIAAWHSKARNAGTVPVACTEARHVSKSKRDKPGTVHIRKEKIIKVTPRLPT